jgi:protein-tyrosine-phosphatase
MTPPHLSVLILCTGNSARSQLAEAIVRHLSQGKVDVESAGSAPQPQIHPMARESARRLLNVGMDGQYPKRLDQFLDRRFDYVITVCDRASETCPIFPGGPQRIHWSFEDPAAARGSDEERQQAFDDVARGLVTRVRSWLALPEVSRSTGGVRSD